MHRDISPSNVLVSFQGEVKLLDFGIARATNRVHRTRDGSVRGKVAYMAPEQLEGGEVDARTDVYALGVVLWELTLRRRLFDGANDVEIIRAALEAPIARPSSLDPYYPPALEAIVMAALDRDRSTRLTSAAEFAARLKAFLREQPTDRDDLAALVSSLFPDEAAESLREVEAKTELRVARDQVATEPLAPREIAHDDATVASPRRGRWLALILLALAACGVLVWWFARRTPPSGTGGAAVAPRADGAVLVTTAVPVAVAVDATVDDAPADASPPIRGHGHAGRGSGHGSGHRDAGRGSAVRGTDTGSAALLGGARRPVADDSQPPAVTFLLGEAGRSTRTIHIDRHPNLDCGGATAAPMSCTTTPGDHVIHVRVLNGIEFDPHFEVPAGAHKCNIDVAHQSVRCL